MSTAIQKQQPTQIVEADRQYLEIRVALNQNLWGMPDDQVWQYYRMMCSHLRLDPASKPFDIITDEKQKTKKLYANISCTSQLGDRERLNYGKLDIDVNNALVALGFKVAHVSIEVRHPNGRSLVAEAFVDLMSGWEGKALSGNNLVNALKKAGTQCRRRGTLQMLGLAAPTEQIPTVTLGDLERAEGDVDGVVIEHPPAAALLNQSPGSAPGEQKKDSGKLVCPRRKLLAEIATELKAKGITVDDLRTRTAAMCDGNDDFTKLDDADIEGLIVDFSQWLDSLNTEPEE